MEMVVAEKITLRTLRAIHELSQKGAGETFGVSGDVWHNWENGKTFPNVPQIESIERAFGVTYNQVIFLTNNNG